MTKIHAGLLIAFAALIITSGLSGYSVGNATALNKLRPALHKAEAQFLDDTHTMAQCSSQLSKDATVMRKDAVQMEQDQETFQSISKYTVAER